MRVLILGGRAPVALDHARRFAGAGHTVWIGDSSSCRLSGASSSVQATLPLPPPRTALRAYAVELARSIETHRIDLVLPTCEEVFFLSRCRDQLPSQCNVFAAPFETLRLVHSKATFLDQARAAGAVVPQALRVTTLASAREWAAGRPVVLKPEFSRFGVHVRIHPEGLPAHASELSPEGAWVVQEYCRGEELCSYGIAVEGRLRLNVCYRPKWRIARSSSFYFEAVVRPEIDAFVARLVARLRFTGQISFDWIASPDSPPVVIECNPRAISGLHLVPAELDVPGAILDANDIVFDAVHATPRMLAAVMLGAGVPMALRRGRLGEWWNDWQRARDVLSVPGDRGPLAGAIVDLGAFARAALRAGTSLRAAATRDIEWDGEVLTP